MKKNDRVHMARTLCLGSLVGALLLAGCSNEEVHWETATSAVGAATGDQETFDERFREYRVGVTGALDEMATSLENARRGVSVANRPEVDALSARVASLRSEFVESSGAAGEDARQQRADLEASYDALRSDIETFLLRAGHSPDELARWRAEGE